ncbi:HAD-IA family hydrolase [Pseudovibrio sp. SPO723]|nr:HAD-IA family hydrolase [Pseudovibrio sp. SPO723]
MERVDFVVFDQDGVLYDFDEPGRVEAYARLADRPSAEVEAAIWGSGFDEGADAGDPDTAEGHLAGFAERLGYPITMEEFFRIRRSMMRPRPQVLALANQVAENVDAAVLTNNGFLYKAGLETCAPEAIEIFGDNIHVSAEFFCKKPDPQVFRRICEHYGYPTHATLFIDDKLANVHGAQEAGLKSHLYEDPQSLKAILTRYKLLNT